MAEIGFIPFAPVHLAYLRLQGAQAGLQELLCDPGYGAGLAVPGLAWTGVVAGQVAGCAGFLPQSPGRCIAWALIGRDVPRPAWLAITRQVLRGLAEVRRRGFWRVEAVVHVGFAPGCRWVEMLGFEIEGLMRAYDPARGDCLLYARVFDGT
jgi:hypothetical protein